MTVDQIMRERERESLFGPGVSGGEDKRHKTIGDIYEYIKIMKDAATGLLSAGTMYEAVNKKRVRDI